jgi:molybdenum cofactor cytidylyltransferase
VLLAAGHGARFGANKLLHELDGRALVTHAVAACLASRLDTTCVVVDETDPSVEKAIAAFASRSKDPPIEIVRNPDARRGMMSSVKLGLDAVPDACRAAMVVLADMPRITVEIIDALIASFERTPRATVPVCAGRMQHPRVIPREMFPVFQALDDDDRAQSIFESLDTQLVRVEVGTRADFVDVDTLDDLDSL